MEEPTTQEPQELSTFSPEQIEQFALEAKVEYKEELKAKAREFAKHRPAYLPPTTRFAKSDNVLKLVRMGTGLGMQVPRDVTMAMGLQRGQLLRVTFELFEADAAKLFEQL